MKSDERGDTLRDGDALPEPWIEAAESYNRPPDTPATEIWSGIEGALESDSPVSLDEARERRASGSRGWLWPSLAAAALLVVGIGIGRMTVEREDPPGVAEGVRGAPATRAVADAAGVPVMRTVALEHLGRSESLLTLVRVDARNGRVDREVGAWGRDLLAETRLLLDSPAVDDPALRELLEDLELILAQVALLDGEAGVASDHARGELEIIARGLEEREVLSRIQAVLPAGAEAGMTGI